MFPALIVVAGVSAVGGILLLWLLKRFSFQPPAVAIILFPVAAFALGFSLRLSGSPERVDLGFFFTDFSFLFVYLVFALSFLLGQIKYWKV